VRRLTLALIVLGVVAFLVVSALLARAFSVDSAERSAITTLVKAEARGDAHAMQKLIVGCARNAFCRRRVAEDAATLAHRGTVSILELNPSAEFSFLSTVGTARVAWRAGSALPVVQCVRVRRAGNAVSGLTVQLLEISAWIKTSANCPARY